MKGVDVAYPNLSEDIKAMLDITSRVDERVKIIQTSQHDVINKIESIYKLLNELEARVTILESNNGSGYHKLYDSIHALDKKESQSDMQVRLEIENIKSSLKSIQEEKQSSLKSIQEEKQSWINVVNKIGGLVVQAIWIIIVSWIVFKLGLQIPNLP